MGQIASVIRGIVPKQIIYSKVGLWLWDKWVDYRQPNLEDLLIQFPDLDTLKRYMVDNNVRYASVVDEDTQQKYRNKYTILFNKLDIDLKDSSFLDLGPGLGDSLDVAKAMGAKTVEFVDFNNYNVLYMRLKGYKGYKFDYVRGKALARLYPRKYDVILSRGAINADIFNRNGYFIKFPDWLNQLENLSTPNGHIIICPGFDLGKSKRHICEDFEAFLESPISKTMLGRGFQTLYVEDFNEPRESFPFTFYKKF